MIPAVITAALPPSGERLLLELFGMLSLPFGGGTGAREGRPDSTPEEEIQRLVDLARHGDRIAQERIYSEHVERVFRTVRGMLDSDAEAEDVTQDAMLTVLTSLHRYSNRSDVRFVAWVTTIAMNTARRRFRRQRPRTMDPGSLPDQADESVDLERDIDVAHKRAALLEALATLGPRERDIVSLRYGAELNASEISRLTQFSPSNVRKILERARTHLRERLEAGLEGTGEGP